MPCAERLVWLRTPPMISWASVSFGRGESTLARGRFSRREASVPVIRQESSADPIVDPSEAEQRIEIVGIERHGALEETARLRHIFRVNAPVEPGLPLKIEVH